MERSRSRGFDLAALGHPVWWAALGVLLINDDLLKGRGLVPGWLTGKLSDFAFLVVAPPLLAALLPRVVPGRRALALLSIVGVYVAADLSRAVSDAVVALAARLGMTWRLWPDLTDLLALAVLPLTIWLMRRGSRPRGVSALGRPVRELAGVVIGAAACLGTSAPPRYAHHPFFVNRTVAPVDVRITWVLRKVDCQMTPEALGAMLNPSDLDDPRAMVLDSGGVAVLDGVPPAGKSPVGLCQLASNTSYGSLPCVAAILEAPSVAPVLMMTLAAWDESDSGAFITCCAPPSPVSRCAAKLNPRVDPGPDALSLVDSAGQRRFVVFGTPEPASGRNVRPGTAAPDTSSQAKIRIAPIDPAAIAARAATPDGCRPTRDAYHAVVAGTSCAADVDCHALRAVPIPSDPAVCDVYVNRGVAAADVETLATRWTGSCQTNSVPWCPPAQPAVCRAGICAPVCPGVSIPACPPSCRDYDSVPGGLCGAYGACLDDTGKSCSCVDGGVACQPIAPVSLGCPLGCWSGTVGQDAAADGGDAAVRGDAGADGGDVGVDAGAAGDAGADGG